MAGTSVAWIYGWFDSCVYPPGCFMLLVITVILYYNLGFLETAEMIYNFDADEIGKQLGNIASMYHIDPNGQPVALRDIHCLVWEGNPETTVNCGVFPPEG